MLARRTQRHRRVLVRGQPAARRWCLRLHGGLLDRCEARLGWEARFVMGAVVRGGYVRGTWYEGEVVLGFVFVYARVVVCV